MILIILLDYEGLDLVQVENVILFILILIGGHTLDSKLGHLHHCSLSYMFNQSDKNDSFL